MDATIIKSIVDATNKAYRCVRDRNLDEARLYFDEAIRIASLNNISTFGLRLNREEMLRTSAKDLEKEIPILQEALVFYQKGKQAEKMVKTFERLIPNLAILDRREESYEYLSQAERFASLLLAAKEPDGKFVDKHQSEQIYVDSQWKIDELRARVKFIRDYLPYYFPKRVS